MWIVRVNTYSFLVGYIWGLVWFNFVCLLCFHLSKRIFKSCGWSPKRSTACWKRWRFGPHCAPACILGVRTRIRSRQNLQPLNTAESSPAAQCTCVALHVREVQTSIGSRIYSWVLHTFQWEVSTCVTNTLAFVLLQYYAQSGSAEHFAKSFSTHASSVEVHAMAN